MLPGKQAYKTLICQSRGTELNGMGNALSYREFSGIPHTQPFCAVLPPIMRGAGTATREETTRGTRSCKANRGMMQIGKVLQDDTTGEKYRSWPGKDEEDRHSVSTDSTARPDAISPFPDTLRDTTRNSKNPRTWETPVRRKDRGRRCLWVSRGARGNHSGKNGTSDSEEIPSEQVKRDIFKPGNLYFMGQK